MLAGRVQAEMYVFLTPWYLSANQRKQLLNATRGSVRIWCYAPGYQEPGGTSLAAMQEVTGFQLAEVASHKAIAQPTEIGKQLGLHEPLGVDADVTPLFCATDATPEETLATYSDGSAAIAMRRGPDGTSLFVGVPGLSSNLLRAAAGQGDVHLFTHSDCNVYANGPYLVVHAAQNGPLKLDVPTEGPVRNLLTGETVGHGPDISLPIKKGETRILVWGEK